MTLWVRNKKIKNFFNYSIIKYFALAFALLKDLVNAKVLGPELLGVYGNLFLLFTYLTYTDFGILHSMNREYPLATKNNKENANNILYTTFSFLIIISLILLLLMITFTIFIDEKYVRLSNHYFVIVGLWAITEQFTKYYINYFRLKGNYSAINKIEIIKNIFSFFLVVFLINKFKVYGIIISMVISGSLCVIYGIRMSEPIKLYIDKKILKSLLSVGIPLLIYNLGFYILSTIDRIMIIKYLSTKDLGYYTLSNQLTNATLMFITSILFLQYPNAIIYLNNKNSSKEESWNYIKKYTEYVEIFGVILIIFGLVIIHPFIHLLMRQYIYSIDIYIVLVFGVIFSRIYYFANAYIVSNNQQNILIVLQVLAALIAILLNFIAIEFEYGILGIAIATSIVNIIYSVLQFYIANRMLEIKNGLIESFKRLNRIIIFSLYSIALLLIGFNYLIYTLLVISMGIYLYKKKMFIVIDVIKSIK
ncbi:Na+-driven multidrug efflux pump [Proteiniborus ethanoligenes]|uniref:Na+-driven multidrug efflux pump n=1 Tax=Proteiniborus ethanoligenes TaxID=415015 RepID=A0A1H3LQX1_9FIRM|nr:oligosaccharide flippase family protein [Proteiniborus ethanoligenes]SDY66499.1 Na+-driven multidrug efflux pump [Proteiniborus ethanoligenes]